MAVKKDLHVAFWKRQMEFMHSQQISYTAKIYVFKISLCSKLILKHQSDCRFGVFIVNFEHILHLFLLFLFLTLKQVNVSWVSAICDVVLVIDAFIYIL